MREDDLFMEMTITRGLAEIKLINDRIYSKINSSLFVVPNKKSNKKINGTYTIDEFTQQAKAQYKSINDLVERRKKIKSAIVDSNAKTIVNIAGKEMTVAEAIERKESIQYEKDLLNYMITQYNQAVSKMNIENEKVQQKLDDLLNTSLGKEGKQKASEDEISIISKPYLEHNEVVLVNPLEIHKEIEKHDKKVREGITEEELEVFFNVMKKIKKNLSE